MKKFSGCCVLGLAGRWKTYSR